MVEFFISFSVFAFFACVVFVAADSVPKCVEQKRNQDGNMQCVLREGELPCDAWILINDKWECK